MDGASEEGDEEDDEHEDCQEDGEEDDTYEEVEERGFGGLWCRGWVLDGYRDEPSSHF